jgi:TRAP-type transport system small permease protein
MVNFIRKAHKGIYSASEVFAWAGYAAIVFMIVVVFLDVGGRYLFKMPLRGAYELVEQSMVFLGGFAIMYCAVKKGHVLIDILINKFSKRVQTIIHAVLSGVGFLTSLMIAWNVFAYAIRQLSPYPEITAVLGLSTAPFQFSLALAMILCSLVFLVQIFDYWAKDSKEENGGISL